MSLSDCTTQSTSGSFPISAYGSIEMVTEKPRAVPLGPGPIKTCPGCGVKFQRAFFKWCSTACKEKARSRDPRRIASVRARNRRHYEAKAPNAGRCLANVAAPPYGSHLPGYSMSISLEPNLVIQSHHRQLLHGLLTKLIGEDHDSLTPAWRLFPVDYGCGWGVHAYDETTAKKLLSRVWPGRIGKHGCRVTFSRKTALKSPALKRGKHRLTVTAITPVCIRAEGEYRQQPTAGNFLWSLRHRVCSHLGLDIPVEAMHVKILDTRTTPRTEKLGEKVGYVRGWVGEVDIEANAIAAWLLYAASWCTGLGSRTAWGMGTIRVLPNGEPARR